MRPAGLEGHPQRLAGVQQVVLADHFVQRVRAQALGQRHIHRRHRRHRLCRRGACRCLGRTAAAAAARLRAAEQVVDHAQLTWAHHRQCFTFTA